MEISSDDYHDFVIKDGTLIGEFEQMYQKSKDIPWHQDKQENWLDIRLAIEILKEYSPFDNITDFGCGLGYFLNLLKRNLGTQQCKVVGYDISKTCCEKAKQKFPDFEFKGLDLMTDNKKVYNPRETQSNNLFAIRGTLWYVFPKMEKVVGNIAYMTQGKDLLLVSQNFPPLENKFVGKNVIPEPDSIVKLFSTYFTPLKTVWIQDRVSKGNDNWFVGVFLRECE